LSIYLLYVLSIDGDIGALNFFGSIFMLED